MKWVTASKIDNWTSQEPRRAQEILPLLIWKLILASCVHINDHHFPFGKSIQYSGYDGYLNTNDESQFIPTGESVWEFGTDEDIKSKFNDDYKKRTDNPNGVSTAITTFCFATTRIWKHRQGIVEATAEKNAEGIWHNVRIIDANYIEMWLETCPSVSVWFAEIIGESIRDVQDLESYWGKVTISTQPKLTSDFFTYGRKSITEQIINQINAGSKQIILVGNSMLEAVLTFAAEIIECDELSRKSLSTRCVVVHTQEAFNNVTSHYSNIVVIPIFYPENDVFNVHQNIVIIPVSTFDPLDLICKNGSRIEIQSRSRREFCEALERLGYESDVAYDIGIDLRCNFNALYRKIVIDPVKKVPEWSKNAEAVRVIPALFAGSWEERKSGDRSILSELSGMNYEDYIATIHQYCNGENKQFFSIDGFYGCLAISDSWDILWSRITQEQFKRFKNCFYTVFSEINPAFELPEDQWRIANMLGKSPAYSTQIKNSMLVSMIMLIERGVITGRSTFSSHLSEECIAVIGQVFRSMNSLDQWRSICPFLPLFMEAAPDVVMRSLEELVERNDIILGELFKTPDNFLFVQTFYTNILWAIEKATWDRHYASRAVNLLVSLAEKQFEYKQTNSPVDSLYRIFCLWQPQGIFTYDERKIILQNIISNHHSIVPALVSRLLSTGTQTTHDILKPKWRSTECSEGETSTNEYSDMCVFISQAYLENITPSFEDWDVVFSNISSFGSIEAIVDKCASLAPDMCEEDIYELCKKLSQNISLCRRYHHTNKEKMQRTDAIEKLYFLLLPEKPRSYAHYFAYHFEGLSPIPFTEDNEDYNNQKQALYDFRKRSLAEMISKYGLDAVWEIIPYIEDLYAYADIIVDEVIIGFDWQQINALRSIDQSFASRVVDNIYCASGLSMLEGAFQRPENADLGWVLSCVRINPEVVDYVESLDDAECRTAYWSRVRIWGVDQFDDRFIDRCVALMLEYNRPYSVIDYFAYSSWGNKDLIIQALLSAAHMYPKSEANGLTLDRVGHDDIQRMFQKLYSQDNVPEGEVAKLEIMYIRVFDSEFEPKYLVNQVLQQPVLYAELLTTAYRSDNDNQVEISDKQREYARRAEKILQRIKRIPGYCDSNKTVDDAVFVQWVTDVTNLAKSSGYSRAKDVSLGIILSYAPEGEDGLWPAECVRRLFEQPHSETLENNFISGLMNQRGVYIGTEGKAEDALADKYTDIADKLQLLYPRTAAIIRRISDMYRAEAKQERDDELKGFI